MEVTDIGKHASLLLYRINSGRKTFTSIIKDTVKY